MRKQQTNKASSSQKAKPAVRIIKAKKAGVAKKSAIKTAVRAGAKPLAKKKASVVKNAPKSQARVALSHSLKSKSKSKSKNKSGSSVPQAKKIILKKTTVKKAVKKNMAPPKKALKTTVSPVKPAAKPAIDAGKARIIAKQPVKSAPQTIHKTRITSKEKPKAMIENYMNTAQQSDFRHILLEWKKELLEEMERTVHHMQDDAGSFADPNDRATQEEEFSLELRTRDRERKLIKKIDEALQRLDNNDYGYCESCGIEIGIERLKARPTATLCIDCKTVDEIREKNYGQ